MSCACSCPSGNADGTAGGTAQLQTFCRICKQARRQTGWLIWEHFVLYADWTKRRQIGQNVTIWDVPSADVMSADWAAKCSQMGPSADGRAHLPTFCPFGRGGGMSAGWAKYWQMGRPIC